MGKADVIVLIYPLAALALLSLTFSCAAPEPPRKYDFESTTTEWVNETSTDSQAVTALSQSSTIVKSGKYSLEMTVDIVGGDEHRSKGATYVEIADPETGESTTMNLDEGLVSVWVYAPIGTGGDPSNPIKVRLYGNWLDIVEGTWFEVKLSPSRTTPPDGYMDLGFDPTNVAIVGVEISAGSEPTAVYRGQVYLDVYTLASKESFVTVSTPSP